MAKPKTTRVFYAFKPNELQRLKRCKMVTLKGSYKKTANENYWKFCWAETKIPPYILSQKQTFLQWLSSVNLVKAEAHQQLQKQEKAWETAMTHSPTTINVNSNPFFTDLRWTWLGRLANPTYPGVSGLVNCPCCRTEKHSTTGKSLFALIMFGILGGLEWLLCGLFEKDHPSNLWSHFLLRS